MLDDLSFSTIAWICYEQHTMRVWRSHVRDVINHTADPSIWCRRLAVMTVFLVTDPIDFSVVLLMYAAENIYGH